MPADLFKTSVDSYVDEARPAANLGQVAYLSLNATAGSTRQGFIYFGIPFEPGDTVFEAILRAFLHGAAGWAASHTLTVERIAEPWGENTLRWSNRPAIDTLHSATAVVTGGAEAQEVDFDITSMLQDVAAGAPFYGVRIRVSTGGNKSLFAAENPNQTLRASLEIDWSRVPFEADNLNPSGGLAVSLAKPVLAWQFDTEDPDADRTQAYSQVQISTTSAFTSPEYDSGKVANTESSWDLSATAYGGVAADATRWWRVRVWDDRNQVSEWSAPVSFIRKTKGTLAISSPGATVNELDPEVTFALTGRTQEKVKIVLFQLDGSRQIEKWVYPKTVTNDTSIQIPRGHIRSGEQCRLAVADWDAIDRAVTQGDPAFVLATKDFTYQRAGSVGPVTNLTAVTAEVLGPGVQLTWHRTSAPTWFCLKVNGVEVMDSIDPDDVHVSGDTYRMVYYGATPGQVNTFEVEAVQFEGLGNHHSQGNDTDTAQVDVTAKWLVDDYDPANPEVLEILMREQADLRLRKSATEYNTVGGQRNREIIDAIGGYGGPISGKLASTEAKEKLEQMVARARPLRFIQSTTNIPIEIRGEPSISPSSDEIGDYYNVSVTIEQIAEFLVVPAT